MKESPPLSKENLLRMSEVISEDERRQLEELAHRFRAEGVITANPAGPRRYRGKVYGSEHCTPLITELGERIAARLNMHDFPVDPYLGYTVSLIEPGGYIHEHIDKYGPYNEDEQRHLRCNIMVTNENDTYNPVISHMVVPVPERHAWAFYASECFHGTQDISGSGPRIIFGFGWTVPGSYVLKDYSSTG